MVDMLQASANAYGDVVQALTCDLGVISKDLDDLEWLASTPSLLETETAYRAAVTRLDWWDGFLADLPCPRLLSEGRKQELQAHAAARARAQLLARDQALLAHQARVAQELADPGLSEEQRETLFRIHEDPESNEWRVDPEPLIRAALEALPAPPKIVPITLQDLDATQSFAGFNAIEAMRTHPALAPLAQQMDAALAEILKDRYRLGKKRAQLHAGQFTGIFWLALRRALSQGNLRMATSVTLVLADRDAPVHEQFSRELLESWLYLLQNLPEPKPRLTLAQRIRGLLGGTAPKVEQPRAAPQLAAPVQAQLLLDSKPSGSREEQRED
jgi:hypothetical protein